MSQLFKTAMGNSEHRETALADAISSTLRVSLPGIIQTFDPVKVTCTVQPALKARQFTPQGEWLSVDLPLLADVPVLFPRGGGCTLTFPVQPGDECLLLFADRCIDFWWQNGGVQETVDLRQHDLSDAFALLAPQSQPNTIAGISSNATQLRTDDGQTVIELSAGRVSITADTITLKGQVQVEGTVTVSGEVTGAGIGLSTHRHTGVQSGKSTSGGPLP